MKASQIEICSELNGVMWLSTLYPLKCDRDRKETIGKTGRLLLTIREDDRPMSDDDVRNSPSYGLRHLILPLRDYRQSLYEEADSACPPATGRPSRAFPGQSPGNAGVQPGQKGHTKPVQRNNRRPLPVIRLSSSAFSRSVYVALAKHSAAEFRQTR